MSGRTPVTLADGRLVRGYRKTLRRNPPRSSESAFSRNIRTANPPAPDYPVRLTFLLPATVLVSPGPHGFGVEVLPGNAVRIRGRNTEHCFSLARNFLAVVASERAGFSCHAVISRDDDERTYGRHLTVCNGALVISGGMTVPKVFEGATNEGGKNVVRA